MRKPLAIDLYCGAGGASAGLVAAGFDVVGVDISAAALRHYPFPCARGDALDPPVDLRLADLIWASPPCQRWSTAGASRGGRDRHPDLIAATRRMLADAGVPAVIENVPAAPIRPDIVLTGAAVGLPIVRRRHFEAIGWSPPLILLPTEGRRVWRGELCTVVGGGPQNPWGWKGIRWVDLPPDVRARISRRNSVASWRRAMEITWMSGAVLAQAVPPRYAAVIGRMALDDASRRRAR